MATKTLYLIRHAKAEEYSFGKRDYNRDIVGKGRERAERIASELAEELVIDSKTLFVSSSANRAIQTAELFADILGYPLEKINQKKEIYEAYHLEILRVINAVGDSYDKLLVFGHNPGLSLLADYLTNTYVELKTSNIAVIELEEHLTFRELSGGTATLNKVFQ